MYYDGDDHPHSGERLRLAALVALQLDNALNEDEAAELVTLLRSSAENREDYVTFCVQAQAMAERMRSRSLGSDILALETPASPANGDSASPDDSASLHDALVLPAVHDEDEEDPESQARSVSSPIWVAPVTGDPVVRRPRWPLALAASVLVAIGAFAWRFSSSAPSPAPVVSTAPSRPIEPAAVITATLDAEWAAPFDFLAAGQDVPAATVQLRAGLVHLRLSNGVNLSVEGPAAFEVHSADHVELTHGRMCADVPPAAIGFAIETPATRVVDLGTSFGVSVSSEHGSRVEVFDGLVELASASASATAPSAGHRVDAGGARQVNQAGTISETSMTPGLFVRPGQLSDWARNARGASFERWRVASERLRRDASLVLYYTFDAASSGPVGGSSQSHLPNHALAARGQWPIVLGDPSPVWAAGRVANKRSIDLTASPGQGLLLTDYPATSNGQLTVAAWVNARSLPRWAAIVKNRGETIPGQFSFGLEGDGGYLVARITQATGGDAYVRDATGSALPVGRWVHVAFVADGNTLRLYRDGIEVGSGPGGPIVAARTVPAMSIGFRTNDEGSAITAANFGERWDGLIDELMVYHRPLSAEEIRRLASVARPGVAP